MGNKAIQLVELVFQTSANVADIKYSRGCEMAPAAK